MSKTTQEIRDLAVEALLFMCSDGLPQQRIDAARELLQLANIEADRSRWTDVDGATVVEMQPG